jgi:VWFA-related protein
VIRRKRELALVLLMLGARMSPASEGMRILTFVPGVANGRLPVVIDLGSSPPPAELLQNGRPTCDVTAVHQTCVVDLGLSPRVTLLELVRRDGVGRVVERARRWVNKPSDARAEVLVRSDCTRASGPCTLTFSWSHENAISPRELTVTIDGAKVHQGEPRDVAMPYAKGSGARVVSVELVFQDGERATQTLLVGSGVSSTVDAPLNAVPVLPDGPAARDPALLETLGGRVVHSVEPGEREVLFVVAPSAIAKLQALTKAAQKPFSRNAGRMRKLLTGVNHVVYFSAVATRGAFSSAARVSDRMYRLQGYDCTPKNDYRERTLALPCVDASLLSGEPYRLAAAVASAAFIRAAVPRRRAVVVVLGDEDSARDESPFGVADARRYLADIFVPLEVWRLGSAAASEWPEGRRLSGADDLVRGWEALRAGLDAQRICWIAEDLDPAAFRLGPEDKGLVLAGRAETAAALSVASAEESEEPGTTAAAAPAGPAKTASQKSVAASQEVALVNLEAFVTDGKGRRIAGLMAADFTLKVGGKPVAITNFSEFLPPRPGAADAAPPAAPKATPAERPKRRVVLFVDRLTLGDPRRSARFFGSLKDFVVRTVQPGDEAAVFAFDETLATRVPFTGDASRILQALDTLAKECARPPSVFTGTETVEGLVDEIAQAEREMAARESRGRPASTPQTAPQVTEAKADPAVLAEGHNLAAREWSRTKRKAAAVRSVLAALGGMDGRRVLVVASHRLSRYAGLEYFLSKRLDKDVVLPQEAHEFDAREILVSLAETANGYGVTLHGLYPEAGGDFDLSVVQRTTPQFTGQPMNGRRGIWIDANESDGLHLAVDDTGGVVGLGAESAADALSGAAEDLESYYSLAFPVDGIAAGRPLAVDLRVLAPGAAVRTRRAVARRSAADRVADRVVSNLFGRIPSPRLPIAARTTATVPAERGRVRVSYEVTIPAANLALLPVAEGRVARIAAFVALLDGGDVTATTPVRREFRTGEDVFADAEGRYVFTGEAVVAPGSTISIGILDEATQEAGFERIEVGTQLRP